jgi:predicted alpha/beta-fold hydrolase
VPLIDSTYAAPKGFANPHVQTIWAGKLRRVDAPPYQRERLELGDGDFLDLDHLPPAPSAEPRGTVVISHGLEGSAARPYVRGMARALSEDGWHAVAWNFRGCSGEMNRLLPMYHAGRTDDLDAVLRHVHDAAPPGLPKRLALVGFSLGGSLTLRYLGEQGRDYASGPLPPHRAAIRAAACFSVPTDLAASAAHFDRVEAFLYTTYFMRSLRRKVFAKAEQFPGQLDTTPLRSSRTVRAFDEAYTAPLHGFAGADDYYARTSAGPVLEHIRVPTLLVSAEDDPFLPPSCYPRESAKRSEAFHLEVPRRGGHVAFVSAGEAYWSERRAASFLRG